MALVASVHRLSNAVDVAGPADLPGWGRSGYLAASGGNFMGDNKARSGGRGPLEAPGAWLAIAAPVILFNAHLLFGAMQIQTALALNIAMSVVLVVGLAQANIRKDLLAVRGLLVPGVLYFLAVTVAVWSLTPYVPGGPNPVWAYVGVSPGASTIDKSATLLEIVKLVGLATVFTVGLAAGANDERAKLTVYMIVTLGGLFALWAFFQHVTGSGPQGRTPRLMSSFQNPNASATLMGMLLVILAGVGARTFKSQRRPSALQIAALGGAALILAACLLLTASRAGFAATLLGLAAFGLLQIFIGGAKPKKATLILLAAGAVMVVIVFALGDFLVTRAMDASQDTDVRLRIFQPHWEAFLKSPLMGYGLGTFNSINMMVLNNANFPVLWDVRATHNVYLQWLEQAGLIGAVPMFLSLATIMVMALRGAAGRKRMTALLYALIAASVVILAHGLTDFAIEVQSIAAFWAFLLGLQFSLAQGSSSR
jgi:O-antigen ligase